MYTAFSSPHTLSPQMSASAKKPIAGKGDWWLAGKKGSLAPVAQAQVSAIRFRAAIFEEGHQPQKAKCACYTVNVTLLGQVFLVCSHEKHTNFHLNLAVSALSKKAHFGRKLVLTTTAQWSS